MVFEIVYSAGIKKLEEEIERRKYYDEERENYKNKNLKIVGGKFYDYENERIIKQIISLSRETKSS